MNRYDNKPIPKTDWDKYSPESFWILNELGHQRNLFYARECIAAMKTPDGRGKILMPAFFKIIGEPTKGSELPTEITNEKSVTDMVYQVLMLDSRGNLAQSLMFSSDLKYYDHE